MPYRDYPGGRDPRRGGDVLYGPFHGSEIVHGRRGLERLHEHSVSRFSDSEERPQGRRRARKIRIELIRHAGLPLEQRRHRQGMRRSHQHIDVRISGCEKSDYALGHVCSIWYVRHRIRIPHALHDPMSQRVVVEELLDLPQVAHRDEPQEEEGDEDEPEEEPLRGAHEREQEEGAHDEGETEEERPRGRVRHPSAYQEQKENDQGKGKREEVCSGYDYDQEGVQDQPEPDEDACILDRDTDLRRLRLDIFGEVEDRGDRILNRPEG